MMILWAAVLSGLLSAGVARWYYGQQAGEMERRLEELTVSLRNSYIYADELQARLNRRRVATAIDDGAPWVVRIYLN